VLTTFDITTGTPLLTSSFAIADGYHNRIEFASNGRVYVGSKNCTGAIGMRGCLSIFNTATMAVVVPPAQGDVTGIAPITGRNVVYVCEGGAFQIYDTTTDTLKVFPSSQTAPVITGMAVDVKLVDP
jgi:hypothetical protein